MSKRNKITIERAGDDEQTFIEVFELLVELHKEGGYGVLDMDKAAAACFHTLSQGMTFVARTAAGKAIGTIGLVKGEMWYSDTEYLIDRWFYVKPANRRKTVGVQLLRAAREEAQARGLLAFVEVDNPERKTRPTPGSMVAQKAGFIPLGYTIRIR